MARKPLLPPIYFLAYLVTGSILHSLLPIAQIVRPPATYLGGLLIAAALIVNIWAVGLFWVRKTTIKPFEASSSLVVDGPFRMSRNPMYVGLVTILLGVAVLLGSLVAFLAPAAMFITLQKLFIPKEEQMLAQSFGQAFLDYKMQVRRWL